MKLNYAQLPKSGEIPVQGTCLLVQGGEEYLKGQLVERLRDHLLTEDDQYNYEFRDAAERWEQTAETAEQAKRDRQPTKADRILALARELPFLGNGRLVIVNNVDALATPFQNKLAAELGTIPPMNHLILITGDSGQGNKATKVTPTLEKAADQHGTIYNCTALTEEDASRWVKETLKRWEQTIEPAALGLLISRAGTDLRRLHIEVDKLSIMAGENGKIRVQDVETLTPKLAEESVFHLVDAVATQDAARALAVLRDLLEGQLESPYRIFPLLVRQFRLIWQTKVLMDAGWRTSQSPANHADAIALLPDKNVVNQLSGWMGNKLSGQAKRLSWRQLENAYQALLECDMASKGIEGVPNQEMDIALEVLCAKLCQ